MIVGTIHKLQGAEAPIVILSSVYGKELKDDLQEKENYRKRKELTPNNKKEAYKSLMPFIDSSPNMLNVAVSRAKDQFVVFGNQDLYHDSAMDCLHFINNKVRTPSEATEKHKQIRPTGLLKAFCNKYNNETPYFFDVRVYDKLKNNEDENQSDSEPVLEVLLSKRFHELKYEKNKRLKEIKVIQEQQQVLEKEGLWVFIDSGEVDRDDGGSHFDFWFEDKRIAIEVDGIQHEQGNQRDRDTKKNKIAEKCHIKLLRLETKTNDSEKDIVKALKKLLQVSERHS